MKPAFFRYVRPTSVADALAALAANDDARVIAGGQSLVPMMAFRLAVPSMLVDIGHLVELRGIEVGDRGVRLGALTRWRDIEADPRLAMAHPLLREAVTHVAHAQIRNRGTIGGSLAHADPASELGGVAIACGATLELTGPHGTRHIPAKEFFIAPLVTAIAPGELITSVEFSPWPAGRKWSFAEFSRRRGDFALAGVALHYMLDEAGRMTDARAAGIAVAGTPLRLRAAEAAMNGRLPAEAAPVAGRAACAECDATDDLHAGADYRRALLGTLVERAILAAACRA